MCGMALLAKSIWQGGIDQGGGQHWSLRHARDGLDQLCRNGGAKKVNSTLDSILDAKCPPSA